MIELVPSNLNELAGQPSSFWLLIFIFAFIDSTFVVGIFLSGLGTLSISIYGLLNHHITIPEIALCAFFGAWLGDQIGFLIGKTIGPRGIKLIEVRLQPIGTKFRRYRLFHGFLPRYKFSRAIRWAKSGFERSAIWILLIGRWLPIASIVPATCAALNLTYSRFMPISIFSCLVWVLGWCVILILIEYGLLATPMI